MEFQELIHSIKEEFPEKAIDLVEGIELFNEIMNDTYQEIGEKMNKSFSDKQFDQIAYYSDMGKEIDKYTEKLNELIIMLNVEEEIDVEEIDAEVEQQTIPNYEEYIVDHKVEHTLYENFTHKRPFGFKINDYQIIEVKTWQEMLVKLGEYLIAINEDKFLEFENKSSMNGKKVRYFSKNPENMRKPRMILGQIYVELNQSGNAIRNLMIKMLKAYDFKINDFKVYFRADYTNLNADKI